ncbi:putative synthase [Tieghemostelium lacteum]|uniref:Putative synthase n=1 Tax=Tieghemostelium lacteum TaxID=361077 RepID=A0A152A6S4_TIELA|nr:putative synthase [Tieghemostelium lacteum]|eukprot:KYR01939.1 putative synthase [Tieghemostelium lacteum]
MLLGLRNSFLKCNTIYNHTINSIIKHDYTFYSTHNVNTSRTIPTKSTKKKDYRNDFKLNIIDYNKDIYKKNKSDNVNNNNNNKNIENDVNVEEQQVEVKKDRLQKVLARAGVASRRSAENLIRYGRVTVDGKVVDFNHDLLVDPTINRIMVDGKLISSKIPKIWLHNKNIKVLVSERDPEGRECLLPILKKILDKQHIIPVGRLDYYSEGLLLLTNDGELSRHLEHPDNQFEKMYRVRIFGKVTDTMKTALTRGIVIDGIKYRPVKIEIESETESNSWIKVTLNEGKKREIRTIFEHFNVKVLRLIRVSYGPYQLPESLKHGETMEVPIKPQLKKFISSWANKEKLKRQNSFKNKEPLNSTVTSSS